jgi:hypothetical protein
MRSGVVVAVPWLRLVSGEKVISCSGLHASLHVNLEIATRLIEEEILEEANNSLCLRKNIERSPSLDH